MKSNYRSMWNRFSSFWWGDKGLSALLLLLMLSFMLAPLLESGFGKILISLFLSLLMLSGVATVSDKWLPRMGAGAMALVSVLLTWLKHFHPESRPLQLGSSVVTLCYLVVLTVVVMRHVYQDGPVTTSRVQGAIAAYILVGLTWAMIYRLFELQLPGSLSIPPITLGQTPHDREEELTYFSFVTLTTLGYGDIVPLHPSARMFVVIEALIGQLFPATLLARLVSLETTDRGRKNRE
jgi:hypothetical protein